MKQARRHGWWPRVRPAAAGLASLTLVVGLALMPAPASAANPGDDASGPAAVEPQVWDTLAADGTATFWVYLQDAPDLATAAGIPDRGAQGRFVVDTLRATAERSQAGVVDLLAAEGADYQAFWIANTVRVTGDEELLRRVAELPEVAQVTADRVYEVPEPAPADEQPRVGSVEWGVDRINAPQVWDEFGATGDGIVVGVIDTGAQFDHPALVGQYRGNTGDGTFDHNYNWYDPSSVCGSPSLEPCDNIGHGSHVTGTIAGDDGGDNQIGVAPGARWIAVKGCEDSSGCTQAALLASGQFMLAPTDLQGRNPRPELRPHIVNNSWGSNRFTDPWYQATVRAWLAAGIFPQFSAGNSGPGCDTAGNPGNLPESYAAGAFDIDGAIYAQSSRGSSAWDGSVKPNLTAPGVAVRSAIPGDGYGTATGTSMASPHVAGAVALLWSAAPALVREIDATRELLDQSAIDTEDLTCGGTAENNNVWGQGRLDAFAAVDGAARGPAGTLAGTITDAGSGAPVAGATITITGATDRERVTGPDGGYSVTLPAGEFTVTASAFGYQDRSGQFTVVEDQLTDGSLPLAKVDHVTVSGRVTDGSGQGWPLYAELAVTGTPVRTYTDPATGQYTLSVPAGESYSLAVTPQYPGYASSTATVAATADQTLDLTLVTTRCEATPGYRSPVTVGVLGDRGGQFADVLGQEGIGHGVFDWGDDPAGFDVIVVNTPRDPGAEAFGQFLADTDAADTGVVFLDNWASIEGSLGGSQGIRLLWQHTGIPSERTKGTAGGATELFYQVREEHPILAGFAPGEQIITDTTEGFKGYAFFNGYAGQGRTVIADAGQTDTGTAGPGIAVQQRDRNRHALLSMHAATLVFTPVGDQPQVWRPSDWTDAARRLFRNAVEWVSPTSFECVPTDGGLVLGQVTDRNTGQPVTGATVTSVDSPEVTVTSSATPADPRLGDGFFWLFSPEVGDVELTAAARRYAGATATVEVSSGAANPADLALAAGRLELDHAALTATVRPGQPAQRTFTVTNTGTAPAEVELYERRGHRPPGGAAARQAFAMAGAVQEVEADLSPAAARLLEAAPEQAPAPAAGDRPAAAPWTDLPDYPVTIMDNAMAVVDGTLYSFGGFTPGPFGGTTQDRGFALDPETGRWREIARMPEPRDKPEAVEIDGRIYVVGGWDADSNATASTFIYDPAQNTWSQGADMPAGRAAPGAAAVDGALYVVGGCTTGGCEVSGTVWRYQPSRDEWEVLPDYPHSIAWLGCGGLAGQVFCTGGTIGGAPTAATYAYHPEQREWTARADAPYPSWGMAYAAADGRLVVSGGATEASGSGSVTNRGAYYHPGNDTWTEIEPASRPVFRAGSACGFAKVGGATGSLQRVATGEVHPDFAECDVADLPWLAADPPAATLAPGQSLTVIVTLDPDQAPPGVHAGGVGVRQQTPYPLHPVDVTVTVREPVSCDREVTGTHRGPLVVTAGVTCVADGATVVGPVVVRAGAGLMVGDATLTGPVAATGADLVELVGAEVAGSMTVRGSTGSVTLQDNRLTGTVRLVDNATGDIPVIVSGNAITGDLSCTGNQPAPVNEGVPNPVTGRASDQCAGL
ncbi:MAG: S8 family serine peptidase [Micromonosporaceae bacterium]|nr:S8 family serine peptidase [Micromonosporaceae bacterium]